LQAPVRWSPTDHCVSLRVFASSRDVETVCSCLQRVRDGATTLRRSKTQGADLGLESPGYGNGGGGPLAGVRPLVAL